MPQGHIPSSILGDNVDHREMSQVRVVTELLCDMLSCNVDGLTGEVVVVTGAPVEGKPQGRHDQSVSSVGWGLQVVHSTLLL